MKNDKRNIGRDPHIAPGVYFIQEELCARIDGDRIIVEKKEKWDEKTRKELIDYLTMRDEVTPLIEESKDCKRWIAYLEKQKEQKPELYDMGRWDEASYNNGIHHVLQNPEAYGLTNQEPAEWSEEDEAAFGDLMWCIEQARKSAKDENDMGNIWFAENWLKNRLKSIRLQPKQEWSEEDEKKITFLERLIRYNVPEGQYGWTDGHKGGFITKLEAISMLKSLCPQPKQDWSEKDEERLKNIIHRIEVICGKSPFGEIKRDLDWLKSLHPQPHWKPSDEQMEALKRVFYNRPIGSAELNSLESLYNDLKKLI